LAGDRSGRANTNRANSRSLIDCLLLHFGDQRRERGVVRLRANVSFYFNTRPRNEATTCGDEASSELRTANIDSKDDVDQQRRL
jgi:hypothetical protein